MKIIRKSCCSLFFISALALTFSVYAAEATQSDMAGSEASATASYGVENIKKAKAPGDWVGMIYSCALGGYKGELEVRYKYVPVQNYYNFYVESVRYRISPDDGRNRANINVQIGKSDTNGTSYSSWTKSPDSMRQDAQWHDYHTEKNWPTNRQGIYAIEFIFDTPIHDIKCKHGFPSAP
ncbi:hypothetical protein [Pseudomonas gingeri]|uniref:hypothetical protein n=1 Tax=Pseudomonas gingeri TaxID=117681 RepID=UPI0015A114B6|nr:hypothetical protein [Pseudomonas gingeri]NWA05891.1 hypothetical protein [Pseudomonas gingeri]